LERTLSSAIAIDGRVPSLTNMDTGMTLNTGEGEAGFRRFSRARRTSRRPLLGFARPSSHEGGEDLGRAAPALR